SPSRPSPKTRGDGRAIAAIRPSRRRSVVGRWSCGGSSKPSAQRSIEAGAGRASPSHVAVGPNQERVCRRRGQTLGSDHVNATGPTGKLTAEIVTATKTEQHATYAMHQLRKSHANAPRDDRQLGHPSSRQHVGIVFGHRVLHVVTLQKIDDASQRLI